MSSNSDFVIQYRILEKYNGPGGDVIIPEGITGIDANAFYGRDDLTSIIIPDGVTKIGIGTFDGCTSLRHIQLPITLKQMDIAAFQG